MFLFLSVENEFLVQYWNYCRKHIWDSLPTEWDSWRFVGLSQALPNACYERSYEIFRNHSDFFATRGDFEKKNSMFDDWNSSGLFWITEVSLHWLKSDWDFVFHWDWYNLWFFSTICRYHDIYTYIFFSLIISTEWKNSLRVLHASEWSPTVCSFWNRFGIFWGPLRGFRKLLDV